jgi:hypothetical protein
LKVKEEKAMTPENCATAQSLFRSCGLYQTCYDSV